MNNRKLTWKREPEDKRDLKFAAVRGVDKSRPQSYQLHKDKASSEPPVWDQGEIGSCTAHGNAYAILRARLASGRRPWTPSRLGLYYMSRELEGTVNSDEGAYVRTGMKAAAKHGVAPERLWNYNTSEVYTKPPMTFYAQAALHKTSSYYAVGQNAEEIESCIYEGFPVVFGFMVYKFSILCAEILLDPLGDGKRRGFICLPRGDTLIGGHCAALCGYDSVMRRFTLRNSYGPEWGDGGYGYIPYEYVLNAELSSDFWTARVSM